MSNFFPAWLTKELNATKSMPKEEARPIVSGLFRKWRKELQATGLCPCGRPAERSGKCLKHAVKVQEANERRSARLIEEGKCPTCTKPLKTDRRRCAECLAKMAKNASDYQAELIKNGLCIRCKDDLPPDHETQTCDSCKERLRDVKRERAQKLVREGRCARCRETNSTRPGKWLCRSCLDSENASRKGRRSSRR